MTLKNKLSVCLLAACMCFGASTMAQEKKEEKRVKFIFVKDGQKHVLDETYSGEMSEELKKKIADFKAEMGAGNDIELHTIDGTSTKFKTTNGKNSNVFFIHANDEGNAEGVITAKIKQEDGSIKLVEKKFASSEEMEKIISELKNENGEQLVTLDVRTEHEEIDPDQVIEIKVTGEGDNKQVWIHKNGVEEEGNYEYVVEEIIEEDGKKKIIKVMIHSVVIEDITEKDKDIPSNLRVSEEKSFGASMSDLNFYPNPNNGDFELKFDLKETGDTKIEVIDLSGKTIFVDELSNFSGSYSKRISLQGQPSGLYILKVAQNGRMMTKKIIVE